MDDWLEKFARANFKRSADTAHDLKTPLNVAVLNLELLRMRLRKILSEEDPKIGEFTAAIETELRRMGKIFDAFFLLSTPPRNEAAPSTLDVATICTEEAASAGFDLPAGEPSFITAHETRLRQACKLFFEGAAKLIRPETRNLGVASKDGQFTLTMSGLSFLDETELARIFKFYYTDPEGVPDLSLAIVRLISETYGGELNVIEDRDTVSLRLSFPLGAQ